MSQNDARSLRLVIMMIVLVDFLAKHDVSTMQICICILLVYYLLFKPLIERGAEPRP
jgi:hypothetical protein